MQILTVSEMRAVEQAAMQAGIPGHELMRTAGTNAAREILRFTQTRYQPRHRERFVVLAGKGNNGGDGLVIAQYLHDHGFDARILAVCPKEDYQGEAGFHAARLSTAIPYQVLSDSLPQLETGTILIDALLGIGLKGPARGLPATLIQQVNASGFPVIAIDTPSGLDCDSGEGAPIVQADLTITMAFPKAGLFQAWGPEHAGLIRVVPIAPAGAIASPAAVNSLQVFGERDARLLLARRPQDSHKNSFGHILCLAGSRTYPGAPFLAAEGALRAGAGLVTLAAPSGMDFRQGPAALILKRLGSPQDAHFNMAMLSELPLERYNAILFGPGIGAEVPATFLASLLALPQPLVLDADGLRLLAANPSLGVDLAQRPVPALLTPHPGEMSALQSAFGISPDAPRTERVASLARCLNAVIVLKGHHSLVATPDGTLSLNLSGGPALATAGTGDVLAGIAGAFLAQGLAPADALRLAVFLHGHAGDLFPGATRSLLADDLPPLLPLALTDLSPFA